MDKSPSSSAELEEFLYHVSHDLRAPIRHIKSLLNILWEEVEIPPTSSAATLKDSIDSSATRLGDQLSALLSLSRLCTHDIKKEEIKLKTFINQLDVTSTKKADDLIVNTINDDLSVNTDITLLESCLSEVIKNALIHKDLNTHADVCISADKNADVITISISDKGLGIPSNMLENIYQPFKRLNIQKENLGVGIGLTLTKKCLEKLGGTIQISDVKPNGTQFLISLPIDKKP